MGIPTSGVVTHTYDVAYTLAAAGTLAKQGYHSGRWDTQPDTIGTGYSLSQANVKNLGVANVYATS
ncbi:hypothetical protein FACS189456_1410 [Bacteroidia bacterium]|nr:hypothetical protein FACS189456_1410 [Bacteroidia bacterium]